MLYVVISVTRYLNVHSSRAASLATEEFIHFPLQTSCIAPISGPLQYLGSPCPHFQRSLEEDSTFCLYIWSPNHLSHYKMETRFLGVLFVTWCKGTGPDLRHSSEQPAKVLDNSPLLGSKTIQRSPRKKISAKRAVRRFSLCLCQGVSWTLAMTSPGYSTSPLPSPLFTSSVRAIASPSGKPPAPVTCTEDWGMSPCCWATYIPERSKSRVIMRNSSLPSSHVYRPYIIQRYCWQSSRWNCSSEFKVRKESAV